MARERTQPVCDGLTAALKTYGVPEQILTDNGRVFTGKFLRRSDEVLFDRICRENGIDHLLTQPSSPTTTGKMERFHRRCGPSSTLAARSARCAAQGALDEWVGYYNTARPHQALSDATRLSGSTPASGRPAGVGFGGSRVPRGPAVDSPAPRIERRRLGLPKGGRNGIVCVNWQQVSESAGPGPGVTDSAAMWTAVPS